MNDVVMIAVDPHKASNTAAVLDPVSKTVIEAARFANTADMRVLQLNDHRLFVTVCRGRFAGDREAPGPMAPCRQASGRTMPGHVSGLALL